PGASNDHRHVQIHGQVGGHRRFLTRSSHREKDHSRRPLRGHSSEPGRPAHPHRGHLRGRGRPESWRRACDAVSARSQVCPNALYTDLQPEGRPLLGNVPAQERIPYRSSLAFKSRKISCI
ncbi:hypothetical protein PENTCL1PPCAC_13846, partial [Pristionchus entomophagus]